MNELERLRKFYDDVKEQLGDSKEVKAIEKDAKLSVTDDMVKIFINARFYKQGFISPSDVQDWLQECWESTPIRGLSDDKPDLDIAFLTVESGLSRP